MCGLRTVLLLVLSGAIAFYVETVLICKVSVCMCDRYLFEQQRTYMSCFCFLASGGPAFLSSFFLARSAAVISRY